MRLDKQLRNILVVGSGPSGGFVGAHLARFHQDVSWLLNPQTCALIKKRGLTLHSGDNGSFTIIPRCASNPRDLPSPDLVILDTPSHDLPGVLDQLEPVLHRDSMFLTLQIGVTSEDIVQERLGRGAVLGGIPLFYSTLKEVGVIEHYQGKSVVVGEMMGQDSLRIRAVVQLFTQAGIHCETSPDIRRAKWERMCWNCVFSPLTALLNDRVGKVLDQPGMSRVMVSIVEEVCAIAMAHRVPLDEKMPEAVLHRSQDLREIHTSMYYDWKMGRPTEIEDLNGYILKKGIEFGIPTPVNEMLSVLIRSMTVASPGSMADLWIEGKVLQPLRVDALFLDQADTECLVPDVGTVLPGMRGKGVRVKALFQLAKPGIDVDHATFFSRDGQYSVCLSLDQARDFGILVYELDGEPLPAQKGGPFRLITPGLGDLCANVKDVCRIQLSHGMGSDTRPADANC